jgi:hypothetical protein
MTKWFENSEQTAIDSPKLQSALQVQPRALQEQPVLQPPPVLELVLTLEGQLQVLHAQWHVRFSRGVDLVSAELVQLPALLREVFAHVLLLHVLQQRPNARVLRNLCKHVVRIRLAHGVIVVVVIDVTRKSNSR